MQPQTQFQRKMKHGNRPLRNLLCVKNAYVISEHVQVIQQSDDVAISLRSAAAARDERWFLKCRPWPGPERFCNRPVPSEMTDSVEESSSW